MITGLSADWAALDQGWRQSHYQLWKWQVYNSLLTDPSTEVLLKPTAFSTVLKSPFPKPRDEQGSGHQRTPLKKTHTVARQLGCFLETHAGPNGRDRVIPHPVPGLTEHMFTKSESS